MASHYVICKCCGQRFDRDKEAYVALNGRRYAHASCYLRDREKNPELPQLEVIDPSNFVTCIYCKKVFDKSKEPFKVFSNGKYAHQSCFDLEQKRELTDQEKLERYIMKLFGSDYVYARIQNQIKDYVTNYGFTYSGIQKALIYYYEVQGHVFDKAKTNGGIGIVPYVYNKAFNYYYSIWQAEQKQTPIIESNSLDEYIPKTVEVHILNPKRDIRKRKLFSFLDNDMKEE